MQQNSHVISSEASLKEANENLTKTSIYAPMSGTVSMLLVELGESVAGTNLMAGTELFRVADLSRMEAQVEVNENDIVRVNLGDTALIEVDAYLDQKFKGIVTEIANSAKTTGVSADQVTNFDVKILVLPESYKNLSGKGESNPFRPGMSATVEIQTESKQELFLFRYNQLQPEQIQQMLFEHLPMKISVLLSSLLMVNTACQRCKNRNSG